MFQIGSENPLIQLRYQQTAKPIIDRGLSSNINSTDFRDLYGRTLSAEQGQAMAGIAEMVMKNSTLSLASPDGESPNPGFNSAMLGRMLKAALQKAPQAGRQAAKFAQQVKPAAQSPKPAQTPQTAAQPERSLAPDAHAQSEPAGQQLYAPLIQAAAKRHNLDPNLVKAVVTAESDFNPMVVSKAGAMGLMQLMPGTAKDLGVDDPFDPAQNVDGGAKYLAQMLERFDGDQNKALAAYNWGPSNVEGGGRYPAETRRYLKKVAAFKEMYSDGFQASA
jgi:soluble lytic murein transglycosylase-like protein